MAKVYLSSYLHELALKRPWLLRTLWAIEGSLVTMLYYLSRSVSPARASNAGRWLMQKFGPVLDKSRIFCRNLSIAFPEKSSYEINALVRGVWGNLGAVLAEYPHLERIYNSKPGQYVELVHQTNLEVFQDDGPAAIFVTAHLANWEIAAASIALQGVSLAAVYTPLQNPWLDRLLRRSRESLHCKLIERHGASRQLMRNLKQGTSVGLIVDQRVDSGEPVPFFKHNMHTSITPAQLALRFKCDLIPVQVQRLANARFRVIFHAPITADDDAASEREKMLQMTAKTNTLFEDWIRERPQEWLCSKRRWAKDLQP